MMNTRIKKIRNDASLSQSDFAESIGLSRMMIAHVEAGRVAFSDRSIRDICKTYNVNEEWLRTGEGEPYIPMTRNQEIAAFMNGIMEEDNSSFKKNFISSLSKLSEEDWKLVQRFISSLADKKSEDV